MMGSKRQEIVNFIVLMIKLYDQARNEAIAEHRTIAGQVEYWAKVGRAALDNPDLPVSFIAEALAAQAEPREMATPFEPRSHQ
jgi:hypothetical protein